MIIYVIIFFFLSLVLTLWYYKFAIDKKIIDKPTNINLHKKNTPKSVGIIIILLFCFFLTYTDRSSNDQLLTFYQSFGIIRIWPIYLCLFLSTIFFLLDDIKNLDPSIKLIFQFIISFFVISSISFPIVNLPLKLEFLISILIIVFLSNVFNFIDGFDGMFSITTFYVLISVNTIIFNNNSLEYIFLINCILMACLLPYSIFNKTQKMKIFIGDCGAATIGILLAWELLILLKTDYKFYILLIFLYPMLDVSITLIKKIIRGRDLFARDFDYFFLKPIKLYKKKHSENFNNFLFFYLINYILILMMKNFEKLFLINSLLIICINIIMILKLQKGLKFLPISWK